MYTALSVLAGVITAMTVAQNGQLAAYYGSYFASAIIHLTGLAAALVVRLFARGRLSPKQPTRPWMYLGGVVGVGTTVFTAMAYGGVGVTAILGLSLLGQSLSSILVDQFGLMGAQKNPFFAKRLYGVLLVALGVAVMLFPLEGASGKAALCALLSGGTIVAARTLNGQLARRQGPMRSTVMNYVTGLATTLVVLLLAGRGEPLRLSISSNWFMYVGGPLGVGLILLLNLTVNRVSAFALTLLQFSGQIFTGLALDAVLTGRFSWQSALGGALVTAGLCVNAWITRQHEQAKSYGAVVER